MVGSNLSDSASRDAVADYLAAVTAQLTGPPSARAAVADELRDGLLEALESHQARGCSQAQANAAAIAEFGDPDMVAAAFGPELGAVQSRRVALGLLVTGPLVGLTWIAAVAVNALPPWRHQLIGPWLALPLVGVALAAAGPALALTVATTGRLSGRLSRVVHRATLPLTAAAVAGLAAVAADLTLLGIITGHALTSPEPSVWPPVVLAASASLTRVAVAGRAARRCLATRAALT
jgi:hypothetical protein